VLELGNEESVSKLHPEIKLLEQEAEKLSNKEKEVLLLTTNFFINIKNIKLIEPDSIGKKLVLSNSEKLLEYFIKKESEVEKRVEEKFGNIARFALGIMHELKKEKPELEEKLSTQNTTPQQLTEKECKNCPIKEAKIAELKTALEQANQD